MKAIMVEDNDYEHFKMLKKYIQGVTGQRKLNYGDVHHLFTLFDKKQLLNMYIEEKSKQMEEYAD